MRLHKYIANCGYTSRRRAELLIEAGRVTVNGEVVRAAGVKIRPGRDTVAVNGEEVRLPDPFTIALNKPAGIITSTHDTHDRLTVMDILPRSVQARGVLPVGRLDQETEGLLILTNDGDLNHRITHPRYETEKEYLALVGGLLPPEGVARLEAGVVIDGRRTAPARLEVLARERGTSRVRIVIREGRKRQVRRMFASLGYEVVRLVRTRVGGVELGDLPGGEWRELAAEEIRSLTEGARVS